MNDMIIEYENKSYIINAYIDMNDMELLVTVHDIWNVRTASVSEPLFEGLDDRLNVKEIALDVIKNYEEHMWY